MRELHTKLDSRRLFLGSILATALVYWIIALGSALTQRPWCDEAWNSSPALCLITNGYMGTPVLESAGTWLTGIERYTYWIMPLHPLTQAAWYEVFGFGITQLRLYSMVYGLVALFSWVFIVEKLSGDRVAALFTAALLSVDYIFVQRSSEGRMDIMSAGLGFAAFAAYLGFRERDLRVAIGLSHTLVAASCFTHPNGVMPFMGVWFLTLYFDRTRLKWWHLPLAASPYLLGLAGWALYISEAPAYFLSQFRGNSSGRFQGLIHPLTALREETVKRFLHYVGGVGPDSPPIARFKLVVAACYLIGVAGSLGAVGIRNHRGYRVLLVLAGIYIFYLTFLEATKSPLYLIHVVPIVAAILAVFVLECWRCRWVPRWVTVGLLSVMVIVQLGGNLYVVRRNTFRTDYVPAVRFLQVHSAPGSLVMGSSELGFELGWFNNRLVDDVKLGYDSHKVPDWVVVEQRYQQWFDSYQKRDPALYRYVQTFLQERSDLVYQSGPYRIFKRRSQ